MMNSIQEKSELAQRIIDLAKSKKLTISLAESCTGGLVSSLLTDIEGASEVFIGAVVAYSNEVKMNLLKVSPSSLERFGAVSLEVASEMAKGVKERLATDLSISLSGIAGPKGGTSTRPVGTVCIGYADKSEEFANIFYFKGDRLKLKTQFANKALSILLERIQKSES